MIFDPRKHAIDEHKRWLGYLQPEGVVVSPVALVDHGVQLDASKFNELQEKFITATTKDPDSVAPAISNFALFARSFLGWRDDLLKIFAVEAEVPDELRLSTGEFGELLYPDAVLKHLVPSDPAKPWMLLIKQLLPGVGLDALPDAKSASWVASPVQKLERLLRAKDIPIGIISNGAEVRLLYAPRGENAGSLTFPVRFMTEIAGRAVTAAMHTLLSHQRLISVVEAARLPALLQASRKYQSNVSTALAEQVLEALYELIRGFQSADALQGKSLLCDILQRNPDEVYHALLTVLLRLVFLLFAEDRGLMPAGALYQDNYSIHGLFKRLHTASERYRDTMDSRFGAWTQILALCRLVYSGSLQWHLQMPAREGHLFDPDRFPFLEGRSNATSDVRDPANKIPAVSDGTIYRVLEKLLILDGERLSYRTLDVEQIGSVYQTMIGFTLQVANGWSIALKPAKSKGAPSFIDLDALLATASADRTKKLKELAEHDLKGAAANALKEAQTLDALIAALDRKVAKRVTPHRVPAGTLILQPTDERRRSGSHYTPRALTAPIVRKTLTPILARLGEHPTPQQILDLKICDPAVGSGAFLVEACRQLGDALVASWLYHGGKPVIPPDEDELLHARRLVAQRCVYGVDRNKMATDLAKLSLWLATLAKDHPFTFLDHSLRTGDALVGLGKKQIIAFHWELDAPAVQERHLAEQEIERAINTAVSLRREILEGGDHLLPAVKAERLNRADEILQKARRAGDLCIAAFFNGDKTKQRATLREQYLDALLEADPSRPGYDPQRSLNLQRVTDELRGERHSSQPSALNSQHPVTPFHWEIEFPEVFARENGGFDAFIGNPPYAGGKRITTANGDAYLAWLLVLHSESDGNADLVAHFFRRAFTLLRSDGTFGLIATNTIRQGDTRYTGLRWICTHGGTIYAARRRYKWPGEAAVIVSVVWVTKGTPPSPFDLDGQPAPIITAYLFHDGGHENPALLIPNKDKSFIGSFINGMGFTFDDTDKKGVATPVAEMNRLLANDPQNAERIFPYLGGEEVNDSPIHAHHRFVINLSDFPLNRSSALEKWTTASAEQRMLWLREGIVPVDYPGPVAQDWPDLLNIVESKVKPERAKKAQEVREFPWWKFWRSRGELASATRSMKRILALSRVGQHASVAFVPTGTVFADSMVLFAADSYSAFSLLQSRPHEAWARFFASSMKDDLRYTPSDCFETFPFPPNWENDAALEQAGRAYYEFRAALMVHNNQGLTETYNRFHDREEQDEQIRQLRRLHAAMDRAVLGAYGWNDLVESGRCECDFFPDYYEEPEQPGGDPIPCSFRYRCPDATRDEVLARLLKLNAERAAQEKPADEAVPTLVKRPKKSAAKTPKAGKRQLTLDTPGTMERTLPSDFRLPAVQPLLYTTNLVVALLSEAGGNLSWPRLLDAFILATTPKLTKCLAPTDDAARVKAWAARWNETVPEGLLLPTLNQLGAKNLTVTENNEGRVFHLLDGPRPPATDDVAYDAWLALRIAGTLTTDAVQVTERARWTTEVNKLVLG